MTRLPVAPPVSPVRPDVGSSSPRLVGRSVHPWAWWAWALAAATCTSLTTNPLFIALIVAAVVFTTLQRRSDAPWARAMRAYFVLAGVVLAIRLLFQVVVGGGSGGTVLFSLPEVPLPAWAAGIRIGGPVTLEGVLFATYEAVRLGAILLCVGAATALANPRRALKSVPAAFHQVSTAIVIALTVAPQLVESGKRIRRARALRGRPARGFRGAVSLVVPVLEDAVERSISLAAGMESRGYGRTRDDQKVGTLTTIVLLVSMFGLVMAMFCWLTGIEPLPTDVMTPLATVTGGRPTAVVVGIGSLIAGVWGLRESGRRMAVSRYRPDPWQGPEHLTCLCAVVALLVTGWLAATQTAVLHPSPDPIEWPTLHPLMAVVVAAIAAPGVLTPEPERELG